MPVSGSASSAENILNPSAPILPLIARDQQETDPLIPMQDRLVLAPLESAQDRLLILGRSSAGFQ
jgi:hypothetical protein